MVTYICEICSKSFNRKSSYDYHINRKRACKRNIEKEYNENTEIDENNYFKCNACDNFFSSKSNMNRHKREYCKGYKIKNKYNKQSSNIDINNGNPKININVNESVKNNNGSDLYSCCYCKKTFTRNYSLSRHLNRYCKTRNIREKEAKNIK